MANLLCPGVKQLFGYLNLHEANSISRSSPVSRKTSKQSMRLHSRGNKKDRESLFIIAFGRRHNNRSNKTKKH